MWSRLQLGLTRHQHNRARTKWQMQQLCVTHDRRSVAMLLLWRPQTGSAAVGATLLTEDGSLRTANTASLRQSDCLLRSTEDHGPVSRSPSGVNLVLFLFFFQRLFVCDETTRRRRRCHLTVTEVLNGADVSRDYHLSNRCVARDNVAVRSLRRF